MINYNDNYDYTVTKNNNNNNNNRIITEHVTSTHGPCLYHMSNV